MRRYPEHPRGRVVESLGAALVNEAGLARVSDDLLLGQWIFLGRGGPRGPTTEAVALV